MAVEEDRHETPSAAALRTWYRYWMKHWPYLGGTASLLLAGMVSGVLFHRSLQELTGMAMQQLAVDVGFDTRGIALFGSLLANNLLSVLTILVSGLLFGLYPLLAAAVNGMVIGSLLSLAREAGFDPLILFLRGILPHGLFEFPAIILSTAYGCILGSLSARSLFSLLFPRLRDRSGSWSEWLRLLPATAGVMALLLLLAAAVEAILTPWLMRGI